MRLPHESPISWGACGVSARIAAPNGARPISAEMRSSRWTAFSAIHTSKCTPAAGDHPSVARSDTMPQKSRNSELTQVIEWQDGKATRVEDYLAAEEPLEMRARRYSLGITLRTPGDDEELVAGFLFTEGIISRRKDLVALRMPSDTAPERNLVRVTLDPSGHLAANSAARRFSAGSACGVCGKASITQLRRGLR